MFFMVSETVTAQERLTATLGPVGRMVEPDKGSFLNISLWTKELGKIWYGDVLSTEINRVKEIAKELKESIFILPEWAEENKEIFMSAGTPWNIIAVSEITPV